MGQVALTGGAYKARSLIANAQRCVNLYGEVNPKGSAAPRTYYPRAGLRFLLDAPTPPITYGSRGMYKSSNGAVYEVIDNKLYVTLFTPQRILLGTINSGTTPVYMFDNGIVLVVVDGSASGWTVILNTTTFAAISDPAFYGSDRVAYLDGFLIFNRPGTTQIYLSPFQWNGVTAFDALDIADKIGSPDELHTIIANAAQLWLIGAISAEVWYNAGGEDFPFARAPGVLIQHGTNAKQSVCQADTSVFWLSQDDQGSQIALQGSGYEVKRFSTHAIEAEWNTYGPSPDAVGFTYQFGGHTFVHFNFPSADKTWVYDLSSQEWHEETWTDSDGLEHMSRAARIIFAYGTLWAADWATGVLYHVDPDYYQDNEGPIVYRRGFPHLSKDGKRVVYRKFMADMEPGNAVGLTSDVQPPVFLRWSDTRGRSFGNPVQMTIGSTGQFDTWPTAWQLGAAIDRVFELFWSLPFKTALNGAYIDAEATDA